MSSDTAAMDGQRPLIEIEGAVKAFSGRVVVDVDHLVLGEQPVEGLLGPNGAGKTTLMRMIMHSISLDEGTVTLRRPVGDDTVLSRLPAHRIPHHGVVKSTQVITDFEGLTALDSLLLAVTRPQDEGPFSIGGERRLLDRYRNRIRDLLDRVGFGDPIRVGLSAGERKLLDILRCLLLDPVFLLLDEPTAGLPDDVTRTVMELIAEQAQRGTSVVIVEHDLDVIWQLCEEVTFMAEGRVLMKGSPDEIRQHRTVVEKYLGAEHV